MARENKGLTRKNIGTLYHPEAVEHILNTQKERGPLTHADAEKLDQEWAASRLAEFTKGHRGNTEYLAHIMSEAPNNASTDSPSVRRTRKDVESSDLSELRVTESMRGVA